MRWRKQLIDLLSEEGDIIEEGDKEYYDVFPHLFKGQTGQRS